MARLIPKSKRRKRLAAPVMSARPSNRGADLERYYDSYYIEQAKTPKEGRKRGIIHPSQLTKCKRSQQYEVMYAPMQPVQTFKQMYRLWDSGHVAEARMRKALRWGLERAGGSLTDNVKTYNPKLMLGGETDGIVTLPEGDKLVLDFKTMKRETFETETEPNLGYVIQLHAYMDCLQIPKAMLFIENRDSCSLKQPIIRWNQDLWDTVVAEIIDPILYATYKGRLLPREEDKCGGRACEYYNICIGSNADFDDVDRRPADARRQLNVLMR